MFSTNVINYRPAATTEDPKKSTPAITSSAASYRSSAGDLANMPTNKINKVAPGLAQTINAVLDTPPAPAKPVLQRPLAKLRPSWIGPAPADKLKTPGVESMKQYVTVEYSSPGLQPPVYIFTNLSDPQWDAVEMSAVKKGDGQYTFSKAFQAEEGEYQYKFRLGPGDWWACDESKPTVDDGMGNRNNLVVVKSEMDKSALPAADSTKASPPADSRKDSKTSSPVGTLTPATPQDGSSATGSPMMNPMVVSPLEKPPPFKPASISMPKPTFDLQSLKTPTDEEAHLPAPLLKHETFAPPGAMSQQTPEREQQDPIDQAADSEEIDEDDDDDPTISEVYNGRDSDQDDEVLTDDDDHVQPLLRHESVSPTSVEQDHAPLFRHESLSIDNNRHDLWSITMTPVKSSVHVSAVSVVPPEADPEDTSLVPFPSHHQGIMATIRSVKTNMLEDETDEISIHSSPLSQSPTRRSISSPSLTSVQEDDEESEDEAELVKLRRAEETEYEREEASGEEMDPLTEGAAAATTDQEPEDADFEPKAGPDVVVLETIIVEAMERRSTLDGLKGNFAERKSIFALTVAVLAVAAGIAYLKFV